MKFTVAWANVLSQNVTLRAAVVLLALCSLVFSIATVRLALNEPIIIERECYSKAVTRGNSKHSAHEIESFLKVAISKRFDTNVTGFREYLSEDEVQYHLKEQDELTKKGIAQKVIVNSVKIEGSSVLVDTDRLIAVGKIRSAVAFPLKLVLSTTDRTQSNPYGLLLKKVTQAPVEESK